jgi:hypothetical protein
MKNIILIVIFCLTNWSCSNQSTDNSIPTDTSKEKTQLIAQADTVKIQINSNYPFGCADLTKLKYPKLWEGDLENYGHLKKPNGHEFENIQQCFNTIHSAKTIKSPRLQKLELIDIGDIFKDANNLDTLMQVSIDNCRYRLPNMGIYECYYSYQRYGNLILLNPETNEGKLLNIYADDLGGEAQTTMRYFYIEKNEIRIFEGTCYDDGCSLDEKNKIIINADGRINIKSFKK